MTCPTITGSAHLDARYQPMPWGCVHMMSVSCPAQVLLERQLVLPRHHMPSRPRLRF